MKTLMSLLILIASTAPLAGSAETEQPLTAQEILDLTDDLFRGKSSQGRMSMTVSTEHWSRTLTMEAWSRGKDESLFRILSPKKEKGTATLRSGGEVWNYLPKVNRVIKLPSSMMSSSWMGSHFTNDDLVKESRMAEDYTFEVTFDGQRESRREVDVTCTPRPEAAVVWGKVVVTCQREDYLPLRIEYFDEDLELARTMIFTEYRTFGDRPLPAIMKVQPQDKPDEYTMVEYHELTFDLDLPEDTFSLRRLRQ